MDGEAFWGTPALRGGAAGSAGEQGGGGVELGAHWELTGSSLGVSPQDADPIVARLGTSTEEGRKVQRGGRQIFPAVFRRLQDPALGGDA